MHEEMRPLLNAYLDGELHGIRLLEMQSHLASCSSCRNELKELRRISDLLHAAPAPEFRPVERFVSNLTLSLPHRTLNDRPPKPSSLLWWLVPAGLLGAWFFVRTALTLTGVVSLADVTGLLGNATAWFNSGQQQAAWFAAVTWLSGGQTSAVSQSVLNFLNEVNVFGGDLFGGFLWQAVIVMLYWAWLTIWWLRRRPRPMKVTASPARP